MGFYQEHTYHCPDESLVVMFLVWLTHVCQLGITAAMEASYAGHTEIVKYLVEHKANVDIKDKVSKVMEGRFRIFIYFLCNVLSLMCLQVGFTALIVASLKGNFEIVKCLVKHNATIDAKTNVSTTVDVFCVFGLIVRMPCAALVWHHSTDEGSLHQPQESCQIFGGAKGGCEHQEQCKCYGSGKTIAYKCFKLQMCCL